MTDTKPRRAKISSQMQVRIPRELYDRYGFGTEAEVVATATGVEFRPVKTDAERCAEIIENLVMEGLAGEELLNRFHEETTRLGIVAEFQGRP